MKLIVKKRNISHFIITTPNISQFFRCCGIYLEPDFRELLDHRIWGLHTPILFFTGLRGVVAIDHFFISSASSPHVLLIPFLNSFMSNLNKIFWHTFYFRLYRKWTTTLLFYLERPTYYCILYYYLYIDSAENSTQRFYKDYRTILSSFFKNLADRDNLFKVNFSFNHKHNALNTFANNE